MLTESRWKPCWTKLLGCSIFEEMSVYLRDEEVLHDDTDGIHSIPYNPVFFSYATVTPSTATLYIDSSKVCSDVKSHLGDHVEIKPYDSIFEDSIALSKSVESESSGDDDQSSATPKKKFLISTNASWALSLALGGEAKVDEVRSPVGDAKAIKNETELEGMRACHVRDGAALIEYFAWLEEELTVKGTKLDEAQAADKLEQIRS